jgi:predicted nucleic acid-binding Zn ribbon protein
MTDHHDDDTETGPPAHLGDLAGMDLVRRTLEEARGAARIQGKDVGRGRSSPGRRRVAGNSRRRWSGPAPDSRDPQLLGSVTSDLARSRGWSGRVAEGSVFGRWPAVVGEQIAGHATPRSLNDGVLTVSAESTAWATQLRMVQAQLLAKIAAAVGDGVVTSLKIVGPAAPSWRKGAYHIAGRGPRDTYG